METTLDFEVNETSETTLVTENMLLDGYLILLQKMLRNVQRKFNEDLNRLLEFVEPNREDAEKYFSDTLYEISLLDPKNLIVSLTDCHSIHFKIFNAPNFETHLEVFYTKEDPNDTIEAVITVFQNEKELIKDFGTLDPILLKYRESIGKQSESFPVSSDAVSV